MSAAYQAQRARTALMAAGAAWLTAHFKAHPREHDEIQRVHDVWLTDIEPLTDDFFQWPRYFKVLFWQILDELVAVCQGRAHDPGLSGDLPTRDEMEHELKERWKAYDHVLWLGHELADAFAGSFSSPNHDRRLRTAEAWYKRGVLDRISKSEWDSQRDDQRKGVIASLDATRLCFRSGRNWATKEPLGTDENEPLPDFSDRQRCPDLTLMVKRVDERRLAAEARAVTAGLMATERAHHGKASIEQETYAVEESLEKLAWWAWWAHGPQRTYPLATIRHALKDVRRRSHTPDIVEKHNAIVEDLAPVRVEYLGSRAHGVLARSLAHRSMGRSALSARQQVVYGRRLGGF